jgi:hypothetical protein
MVSIPSIVGVAVIAVPVIIDEEEVMISLVIEPMAMQLSPLHSDPPIPIDMVIDSDMQLSPLHSDPPMPIDMVIDSDMQLSPLHSDPPMPIDMVIDSDMLVSIELLADIVLDSIADP